MIDMSRSAYVDFWLTWDFSGEGFSLNRSHMETAIFASYKYKPLGREHFRELLIQTWNLNRLGVYLVYFVCNRIAAD